MHIHWKNSLANYCSIRDIILDLDQVFRILTLYFMRVKLKDLQTFFCGHLLNFSCETVIITHYMLVCRLLTTGNTLVFSLAVERTRQTLHKT